MIILGLISPLHPALSQWLEKDFLAYLDEWQTSVASWTELTASAKNKLCRSLEFGNT